MHIPVLRSLDLLFFRNTVIYNPVYKLYIVSAKKKNTFKFNILFAVLSLIKTYHRVILLIPGKAVTNNLLRNGFNVAAITDIKPELCQGYPSSIQVRHQA